MKSRLIGSACFFALTTTLSSASVSQPLEDQLPAILGGTYAAAPTIGGLSAVPVTVWVVVIALIGLDVIARRKGA
jgi:hypothetical protein